MADCADSIVCRTLQVNFKYNYNRASQLMLFTISPLTANIYLPAIPTMAAAFHKSTELINITVTVYMVFQGICEPPIPPASLFSPNHWHNDSTDAMGHNRGQGGQTPYLLSLPAGALHCLRRPCAGAHQCVLAAGAVAMPASRGIRKHRRSRRGGHRRHSGAIRTGRFLRSLQPWAYGVYYTHLWIVHGLILSQIGP